MSKHNLKPCPFCGGEPDVGGGAVTKFRINSNGILYAVISCQDCGAEMPVFTMDPDLGDIVEAAKDGDAWIFTDSDLELLVKAVTAAWNRRPERKQGYGTPDMAGMGVVQGG